MYKPVSYAYVRYVVYVHHVKCVSVSASLQHVIIYFNVRMVCCFVIIPRVFFLYVY